MKTHHFELSTRTTSGTDVIDITDEVVARLDAAGIETGSCLLFVPGSTAALTTIEYESGVVQDLVDAIERLAPRSIPYAHDARWGDGNGYSHVRAALLGPSLTIPVYGGKLTVGTWQQIVVVDFDNRPRTRRIVGQLVEHIDA